MQLSDHEHEWLSSGGAKMMTALGLAAGSSVIDFGCGKGRYTIPLSRALGRHGSVIAMERDPEELEQLKTRITAFPAQAPITPMHTADISLGTVADNTKDAVMVFDVLQYIDDWPVFFTAVHRVLKSPGALHIYPAAIPHPGSVDLKKLAGVLTGTHFKMEAQHTFTMMHNKDMVTDTVYTYRTADS